MIILAYFFVLLANTIAVFLNKKRNWLIILTILFIAVVWAGNTVGPDINNYHTQYKYSYLRIQSNSIEIVYNYILDFFSSNGISFTTFRLVISILGLALVTYSTSRFKVNIHGVFCAYLVCQFFMDGIQIRNFMAFSFLFLGLSILLRETEKWRLKYIICIFIATLIHESFLVYLVFLLIPKEVNDRSRIIKMHAIVAMIISSVFFLFRGNLSFLVYLVSLVDSDRAQGYTQVTTNLGPFICVALQIAAIFLSLYVERKLKIAGRISDVSLDTDYFFSSHIVHRIFWVNILGLYLLPFTLLQLTFYRLIRNVMLINIISLSYLGFYYKKSNVYILWGIAYLLLWQITEFSMLGEFDVIVKPFFDTLTFFA